MGQDGVRGLPGAGPGARTPPPGLAYWLRDCLHPSACLLRYQSTELSQQKQDLCLLGDLSFSAGYIRKYKTDVVIDGEQLVTCP